MNSKRINEILESLRKPEPHQLDLEDGIWTDGYHQALADVSNAVTDEEVSELIDMLLVDDAGMCHVLGGK